MIHGFWTINYCSSLNTCIKIHFLVIHRAMKVAISADFFFYILNLVTLVNFFPVFFYIASFIPI